MLSSIKNALWKSESTANGLEYDLKHEKFSKVPLPCKSDSGKFAIVIKNTFSEEECAEMIRETESRGYEAALLNVGGGRQILDTDHRRSSRCIVDSPEQAAEIWNRVKDYVPAVWNHRGTIWEVVGLNERLRYLRYNPGDFFAPHFDGCYERGNGERSFITLQLYLNEGFDGGDTTFIDMNTDTVIGVTPKTGSVLIFQHDIYHSGAQVTGGRKYAMRTDVMFRRQRQASQGSAADDS
jgi:predicted 2-oxoglutarate/Fe(II)-dependent dioxygenase YbiX